MRNFLGGILGILMLFSLFMIILGIMKPVWTVWWTTDVDRWKSSGAYGSLFLISLLLSGLLAPHESAVQKEIRQIEKKELEND